ncbi:ras-related protein Rab-24-like [Liolophura sinensis]|uniref:ras-related protein Rab-24-like n=1 Tax=Liolophura sinensis TaxID=3198878 RepID=UPI003158D91A
MSGSKIDLKVVLLGKSYAGKTSLVERFIHGRFSGDVVPYQNTIGAAFGAKKIVIGKTPVVLGIWDTAGSERYEAMSRIYYRGAKAAIVCYDLADGTSFDRAKFWINELQQNEEACKVYLCGTKKDIIDTNRSAREVDYHTTTDYADEISADIFETSSKSGENIEELFAKIAEDYLAKQAELKRTKGSTDSIKVGPEMQKGSSCCPR